MNSVCVWLLLLLGLLLPLRVRSQTGRGISTFFLLGHGRLPGIGSLPGAIAPGTARPFNDHSALVGMDLQYRSQHWLAGLTITTTLPQTRTALPTGDRLRCSASNAQLWLGWVVSHRKRLLVYPRVGPGVTTLSHLHEPRAGLTSLRYLGGFSTDFGLAFDWQLVEKRLSESLRGGPMLGLRVGYRIGAPMTAWRDNGPNAARLVPDSRAASPGFYVTLALGGGYYRP